MSKKADMGARLESMEEAIILSEGQIRDGQDNKNLILDVQERVKKPMEMDDLAYHRNQEQKFLRGAGFVSPDAPVPPKVVVGGFADFKAKDKMQEAGVLPIRVRVPVGGQVHRFSKSLLLQNVPIPLTHYYFHERIMALLKGLGLLFLLVCVYRLRRQLWRLARAFNQRVQRIVRTMKPMITHPGLVITTMILCLFASYVSLGLLIFTLLLFLLAVARWLIFLVRIPQGD